MKKFKAFTLTEIVIAATFVGIVAALTIPTCINSLKYREHAAGYRNAFEKVQQVAGVAGITDSSDYSFLKFYETLNETLPVVGYTLELLEPSTGNFIPGQPISLNPTTLATGSKLYNFKDKVIGNKNGTIAESPRYDFSPWIITENGMAFGMHRYYSNMGLVGMENGTCGSMADIYRAKEQGAHEASLYACVFIWVDVNGLDKGPNRWIGYASIEENEAKKNIEKADVYPIYIAKDGVSPGPYGTAPYWIMKNK